MWYWSYFCPLIIFISSLDRCLLRSLSILMHLLYTSVCNLSKNSLYFAKIFSPLFVACLFLNKIFHGAEIFYWIKYMLLIFFPFVCGIFMLCVKSQSSWSMSPDPWPYRFSSMFSSTICRVSYFKFVYGQFGVIFVVSYKVCVYIYFIAYVF